MPTSTTYKLMINTSWTSRMPWSLNIDGVGEICEETILLQHGRSSQVSIVPRVRYISSTGQNRVRKHIVFELSCPVTLHSMKYLNIC